MILFPIIHCIVLLVDKYSSEELNKNKNVPSNLSVSRYWGLPNAVLFLPSVQSTFHAVADVPYMLLDFIVGPGVHALILWDFEMQRYLVCLLCLFQFRLLLLILQKRTNKCHWCFEVDRLLKEWKSYRSRWLGRAALINYACLKLDLCPSLRIEVRGAFLWFLLWVWPRSIASKRKLCWIITNFICAGLLEIRKDRWVAVSAHLITPFPKFSVASFWISLLLRFSSNFGHWIMLWCPIQHLGNVINSSKVSQCHPARDKCNNRSGSEWYPS